MTEAEKALEIYHRTRREVIAQVPANWTPSAIDRLAALGDSDGALAKRIAAWEAHQESIKLILRFGGGLGQLLDLENQACCGEMLGEFVS